MRQTESWHKNSSPTWLEISGAVIAASLAMAATLPGRTHGLGLITTRLLTDFTDLGETGYAKVNLIATLLGSLMCLPCGWLIDRCGIRAIAVAVVFALAGAVFYLATANTIFALCVAITLTRGIGQSMLSVVSLAIIGKTCPHRPGAVMGTYAVVMTFLIATWTGVLGQRVTQLGWRSAWYEMSWVLCALAPLVWICIPRVRVVTQSNAFDNQPASYATLSQALATPCFWVFALGISLFGMVSSGVSLFQQSIFASQGFSEGLYHQVLVMGLFIGMFSNLLGGWMATKLPLQLMLGAAMWLLAAALAALPFLSTTTHAYAFCVVYGIAGGWITVLFFTVWSQAFGTGALGKIQGAAQMLTVLASSVGPLLVTESHDRFQSYHPILLCFAFASMGLGTLSIFTAVPSFAAGDWQHGSTKQESLALSEST